VFLWINLYYEKKMIYFVRNNIQKQKMRIQSSEEMRKIQTNSHIRILRTPQYIQYIFFRIFIAKKSGKLLFGHVYTTPQDKEK